mmetsp:Transcript_31050/g.81310  ORF Transcript_31050/g.81310 Transcript_31050/m.81310 type:complete len:202 (+) Transcript_31050:242-847(+)
MSATHSNSTSLNPRVVMAGAPTRMPPGERAERSPGTQFLFRVTLTASQIFSILEPVTPRGRRSIRQRWFSVPPVARDSPFLTSSSPRRLAFALVCTMYSLNSGEATSFSCAARPPIWCSCGPPWSIGKTEKLTRSGKPRLSFLTKIIPDRGPRSDLCVVVVTTSQNSKGDECSPVATRPEMCAMSIMRSAPTESAIARNLL